MLTSFVFVPVAGFEPARLGSSIELHGIGEKQRCIKGVYT